jgi:hypothetical protein
MITTEVVALAIAAWFLISFLFGLVAGRIIQTCRCHRPGFCEICRVPGGQDPPEGSKEPAEPNALAGMHIAG